MRKLILFTITALLGISFGYAQDAQVYNFIFDKGEVFWQKIYFDADSATVVKYFSQEPFKNENSGYSCNTSLYDYSDKGYMSSSLYIQNLCTIKFNIQVKQDRYRVTVQDIIWEQSIGLGVSVGFGFSVTGANHTELIHLKDLALNKKGKIKFKITGGLEKQLNYCLNNLFNIKNYKEEKKKDSNIINSDF